MAGNVTVSVVIAAFDAAPVLARAVRSALGQEGVAVEVIVSDDASRDDTRAVAEGLAAEDPRVVVVAAERNGGPSAARNLALARAAGRWVAVLDADDAFLPGRLAHLVAAGEARAADIVLDNLLEVDAAGVPFGDVFVPGAAAERWDLRRWATDNRVLVSRCTGFLKPLIRRDFLVRHGLRYDPGLRNSEDYALVAECLAAGASVWFVPEAGYLYTRAEGSASHRLRLPEVAALRAFSARFAAQHGDAADPGTRDALRAHLAAVEDAAALAAAVERLKARAPVAAAAGLAARPSALPLLARSLREAAAKRFRRATRGGP